MEYVPTKGYFDLTERPKGMSAITHKKIQEMQMVVVKEASKYKDQETKKNNQFTYNQLRELAAELQQIIFSNWPHETLFK